VKKYLHHRGTISFAELKVKGFSLKSVAWLAYLHREVFFHTGKNGIYFLADFMFTEEEPCPRKNIGFGRNARRALVATSPF
jgi:hypothetical protein